MKMPRRTFYPIARPPDIFGLRRISLIEQAGESEADIRKRFATVEEGVVAAFMAAVSHLGEDEARRLFKSVLRRAKRGPGKMFAPDRDARLIREYDAAFGKGETVAALAKRLRAAGRDLGNTENAIAAQIRKLVKERKKRERATAVENRRWRIATRNEVPSLLSAATSEK